MGLSQSKKAKEKAISSKAVGRRMEVHIRLVNNQIGIQIDKALELYKEKFTSPGPAQPRIDQKIDETYSYLSALIIYSKALVKSGGMVIGSFKNVEDENGGEVPTLEELDKMGIRTLFTNDVIKEKYAQAKEGEKTLLAYGPTRNIIATTAAVGGGNPRKRTPKKATTKSKKPTSNSKKPKTKKAPSNSKKASKKPKTKKAMTKPKKATTKKATNPRNKKK